MELKATADKYLEKIRFWNMILLIFAAIGGVVSILEIPSILNNATQIARYQEQIDQVTNPQLISLLEKSLALVTNPLYRFYGIVVFVISMALLFGYYSNNKRIKAKLVAKDWPYYGQLIKIILAMVVSAVTRAFTFDLRTSLTTLFLNLLWCIPAILALRHNQTYRKLRQEVKTAKRLEK